MPSPQDFALARANYPEGVHVVELTLKGKESYKNQQLIAGYL
jgi:hypothetical protein